MTIKLKNKILAGIILTTIICAVCAFIIVSSLKQEQITADRVADSQERIERIKSVLSLIQDCETGSRGFVITNEEAFKEPFNKAVDSLPKVLASLKKLVTNDLTQQKRFASLIFYVNKKIEISQLSINTRRQQNVDVAMQLIAAGSGKTTMDSIRSLVGIMLAHENRILLQRKSDNDAALSYSNKLFITIIVLFIAMLLVLSRQIWTYLRAKRAVEEKLVKSNERFNFVAKATSDAIWDWELSTGTIFWSNNFELLFGYDIVDNKGDVLLWEQNLHPDDRQRVMDGINKAVTTGSNWQDEYRFLKADGNYAYVCDTAVVIHNEKGEAYRMTGSMRDITLQKKVELELHESNKSNKIFIQQAPQAIAMVDKEMRYLAASLKWISDYKLEGKEILGQSHYNIFPEIGDDWKAIHQACLKGETNRCDEASFLREDGTLQWLTWDVRPWYISENTIGGLIMYTSDITNTKERDTEKKRIETILELSNSLAKIGTFEIETKTEQLKLNLIASEIFEFSKGYKIDYNKLLNFYKKGEQFDKLMQALQASANERTTYDLEVEIVTAKGTDKWLRMIIQAEFKNDVCIRRFGIIQDITKSKKVSNKLLLANHVSNIGTWEWDFELNTLEWDETSYRLFGITEEGLKDPKNIINTCVHPDDREHLQETNAKAKQLQQRLEVDYRVIWPDKSIHYIESRAIVLNDAAGKPKKFIGTNLDITERKKTEENERNLHNHIQLLLNSASEGLYGIDTSGNCTFINKEGALMLGYEPADCIGQNMHKLIHYKKLNGEELPVAECAINIATKANQSCSVETEVFWKSDGSSIDVLYTSNPILENEKRKGAVVTFSNITERKTAQRQLLESEKNLNAILFSTQEGLYLLDNNFKLVLMNQASEIVMRKISGKDCKPGEDFLDCFNPEMQVELRDIYERVLQGEQIQAERQATEKGIIFYYSAIYFPVKNEHGIITNICCTSSDITEKKLAEEIIKAANEEKDEYQYRFQSIVENSPQAVLIKNLEGYFTFINKSFIEAFGIPPEDVIGKRPNDIFTDPEAVVIFDSDEEILVERKIAEWEQEMTMRSGEKRHFQIIKFPVYDRKETLFGIGTICKDITEIKNYEYNLILAREKAENAERLQEQFLANMSHELRTPMNGIIGMANVLANSEMHPQQKQQLDIIQRSSDTLLNLINDILDLSKIKAGMLSIENVDFDFNETMAVIATAFKGKTLEKGIKFIVQTEPFIPRFLSGDPLRLTQILNNLLSNAIKFTEKGFVKLEASLIDTLEDDIVIEFIVTDSGIGIDQSSLESIFNSFEQASSDISRKYGGTGLGLPITKRLVELQGGKITVESNPGIGSVFTFSLPYNISKTKPVSQNQLQKHITPIQKRDYTGKHVLITEDNEINQEVLSATLKQYKLSFTIANNGQEAVDLLKTGKHFDLVFMDLRMPVMNGFQATAYIREKLQLQIPIVILTASVLRNEREKCLSLGANDYMSKPINHTHLDLCLQKFLHVANSDVLEIIEDSSAVNSQKATDEAYDISNLLELGDEESIRSVLGIFSKKFPQHLSELIDIVNLKDKEGYSEKSHKLRGSLTTIQIPFIDKLTASANVIVEGNGDWDNVLQILNKVSNIYTSLTPKIFAEVEQQILSREI